MTKLLKTIHNWGGIFITIPLFLTCFTGGILGISDLLDRADSKHQVYSPMSPQEKSAMYAILLEKNNEFTRFRTPHESRPYASAFSRGHTKFYNRDMELIDERIRADHPIMNGIFFFHRHFLIGQHGFTINGIVSLLATVFILIGIYLWWNKYRRIPIRKAWPRSLKPRELFNSHILAGVIIALPFLILSYTGFHLVFGNDIFSRVNNTLTDETSISFSANNIEAQLNEAQAFWPDKDLVSVVRVVERLRANNSQPARSVQRENSRPRRQTIMTGIELRFTSEEAFSPQGSNALKIDLRSGEVIHKTVFAELPFSEKLKAYVRPLHDGLNLPSFYVVIITITSFLASFILLFSSYTFVKRISS